VLSAVGAIGIMVVIARYLDQAAPVTNPQPGTRAVGKLLGWIVFAVLLVALMYLPIRLIVLRCMRFPDGMQQVQDVLGLLRPAYVSAAARSARLDRQALWVELCQMLSQLNDCQPWEITEQTRIED
jgi:hypothetical protein